MSYQDLFKDIEPVDIIYKCEICKDDGLVDATLEDIGTGIKLFTEPIMNEDNNPDYRYMKECECKKLKDFKAMMSRSGLDYASDLKITDYIAKYDWQKEIKQKLYNFVKRPTSCFLISGQSGSGKTMAMSILFKNLVGKLGKQGHYLEWETFITETNNNYREIDLRDYGYITKIPILYIDDFLKSPNNDIKNLSHNEIRFARNIINQRYKNKDLITLISTELSQGQLEQLDQSLHGRLVEMSTLEYFMQITESKEKNIRVEIAKGKFKGE